MKIRLTEARQEIEIEYVDNCPYCAASESEIAYSEVMDWSFWCSEESWTFRRCKDCASLYLSPRLRESSISSAYRKYYTHKAEGKASSLSELKRNLKNDYLSFFFGVDISPRLHLPAIFWKMIFSAIRMRKPAFWMKYLVTTKKGNFLDFGCGQGFAVNLATQLGWKSLGIDFDQGAVDATSSVGESAIQGNHKLLLDYPNHFDYILCSHVVEHVYDPIELLKSLYQALAPGGVLVLAAPNANSKLLEFFGSDWRGLEAPRHIAIPSQTQMEKLLTSFGLSVASVNDKDYHTAKESFRIRRRSKKSNFLDFLRSKILLKGMDNSGSQNDSIRLVCKKAE